MISLEVRSADCSLDVLTEIIGGRPSGSSHSIGDVRFQKKIWANTVYKYEIGEYDETNIFEAWGKLRQDCINLSDGFNRAVMRFPSHTRIVANIGIISNTPSISILVPSNIIKLLAAEEIGLEITTYQCE